MTAESHRTPEPEFGAPDPTACARLLALDWGTSQLRARLLGAGGQTLALRQSAMGIMAVQGGAFEDALQGLCGDWLEVWDGPILASGMIGSRQAWVEAPYLSCPAGPADAAAQLTRVAMRKGRLLHVVPGLRSQHADGRHDVMRGEETQIWGADLGAGECVVLPGTHSKWAWLSGQSQVERFATFMTGELFGVLVRHSILGRLMPSGADRQAVSPAQQLERDQTFDAGVNLGWSEAAALTHILFSVRTAGLLGQWPEHALADALSGMLIGAELAAAARFHVGGRSMRVCLLGDAQLCARYQRALQLCGIVSRIAEADATARGQWRIARAAGLLP